MNASPTEGSPQGGPPNEKPEKLAIVGATGSVGRELVTQALAAGHEVTALVRSQPKAGEMDERVALVSGDVTDTAAVKRTVDEATRSSVRSATQRARPTTSSCAQPRT